jgi:hypothetical protein
MKCSYVNDLSKERYQAEKVQKGFQQKIILSHE